MYPYKRETEGDFTHKKRSVIQKQRLSDVSRNAGSHSEAGRAKDDRLIALWKKHSSADPLAKAQILSLDFLAPET